MAASAPMAPKAGVKDFLEIVIIEADVDWQKIAAARALGFIAVEVAMGIPVNLSGKGICFDRPTPAER